MNDPLVILADEPTGNLDSKSGTEILEVFDELHRQGKTMIMVTHDDDIAHRGTRNVRFRDGVLESDTRLREPASKLNPPGELRRL